MAAIGLCTAMQLAAIALWIGSAAAGPHPSCPGDCNHDGRVGVDEIVAGVGVALGRRPLSECSELDSDADGGVTIDELVRGVSVSIAGCRAAETGTPTRGTASPTRSRTPSASPSRTATCGEGGRGGGRCTFTPTPVRSAATSTMTVTPAVATPTPSATPTLTATELPPPADTETAVSSPSETPTPSPTPTPTRTLGPVTIVDEVVPLGDEFEIGDSGFGYPSVCSGAGGSFAVAWWDRGVDHEVIRRAYDDVGVPFGPAEAASSDAFGLIDPDTAIACAEDGRFIVAWSGTIGAASRRDVFARRYAADGEPLATEMRLHAESAESFFAPRLAVSPSDTFLAAWARQAGNLRRKFSFSGAPLEAEQPLAVDGIGPIAVGPNGEVVSAWTKFAADGDGNGVFARRLAGNGSPFGPFFQVATQTAGDQGAPAIAIDGEGRFVVAWSDRSLDGSAILARRFAADGAPLGGAFQVNEYTEGGAYGASVALDGRGAMIFTWESARDAWHGGIFGRRFDGEGGALGGEFQVNTITAGDQRSARVAAREDGGFVVVWDKPSIGQSGRRFGLFPTARESIEPCPGSADDWTFEVRAGQALTIRADTTAAESAADLCLHLQCGTLALFADDEMGCRFPPSSFGCPEAKLAVAEDGLCSIRVGVCSEVCGAAKRADYALLVYADDGAVAVARQSDGVAFTPSGTPKLTPTATPTRTRTPTPTRPPSELRNIVPLLYRSLNAKVYVLIPAAQGEVIQITSMVAATDPVIAFAERFEPGHSIDDPVVTALAGVERELVPPASIRRTEVLDGLLAHPADAPARFDACAISGDGLLTLQDGLQVTSIGRGPHAPAAAMLYPLGEPGASVPAAIEKQITRRISTNVRRQTIVFPSAPATCSNGSPCTRDEQCAIGCAQAGQGCCGHASAPPGCSGAASLVCDPAQTESCVGTGSCTLLGGEVGGQNVTLDDTLGTPVGNPASQAQPDGFRLDGRCDDPARCQALVLELDLGEDAAAAQVAVAGFLLDDTGLVRGTVRGIAEEASVPACDDPKEFRINSFTAGDQSQPALCAGDHGDFVVAWQDSLLDGDADGIFAQRYAADGAAVGTQFQVNLATVGSQSFPDLACGSEGSFVAAWNVDTGIGSGVAGRRFNGDGQAEAEFTVAAASEQVLNAPAIASNTNDEIFVAWQALQPDGLQIRGRRFSSAGEPVSSTLQVGTPGGFEQYASAAAIGDGGFVVAWRRFEYDDPESRILMRRYSSGGSALGSEQELTVQTTLRLLDSAATGLSDGGFLVAWTRAGGLGACSPGCDLRARRYSSAGIPSGTEFQVSTAPNIPRRPAVDADASGEFALVWEAYDPTPRERVQSRRYTSAAVPVGPPVPLDTHLPGFDRYADVAFTQGGDFVVVWQGLDPAGFDDGIFAQRVPR